MIDNVAVATQWAQQMLEAMSPAIRQRLLLKIARQLRTSNARRIRQQQSASGERWQSRKDTNNRKKMLQGMAKRQHLKAAANTESSTVGYKGSSAYLARIHHHGMVDSVVRGGPKATYPARPLLGLSDQDIEKINQTLLAHFGSARS